MCVSDENNDVMIAAAAVCVLLALTDPSNRWFFIFVFGTDRRRLKQLF